MNKLCNVFFDKDLPMTRTILLSVFGLLLLISMPAQAAPDLYNMRDVGQKGIVTTSVPSAFIGNFADGNTAVIACDKAALDSIIRGLEEQKGHLYGMARATPHEFLGASEIAKARADGDALARGINNLKYRWNDAQPCGEPQEGVKYNSPTLAGFTQSAAWGEDDQYDAALRYAGEFGGIRVAGGLKAGAIKLKGVSGFGGTEAGGANRQLGVIKPDSKGNIFGISSQLRIPLGYIPNLPNMPNVWFPNISNAEFWDLALSLEHMKVNLTGVEPTFNVGGQDFLLPGVGTGPNAAGFVIPAPNGDVTNIMYDADHEFGSYDLGFGRNILLPSKNNVKVRPFGGLRYGHSKSHETFSGITNAATLPFSYDTKVKNKFLAPFAGVELTARPPSINELFGAPIEFSSTLRYAYAFNDAEGDDTLTVQGFVPATAMMENNDGTHDFKARVGFTINPDGPFSVAVGGNFERVGNVPEVTRDGTDLSQLRLGDADVWTGDVRFILKF